MAKLRKSPQLWKSIVPIKFHVDYWNRLGWHDRFSKAQFTSRQNGYAQEWKSKRIYTPGFVLNGKEWRSPRRLPNSPPKVGKLSASKVAPGKYKVTFTPTARGGKYSIYAALLGNGLETKVKRGENSGRTLRHEFVVLKMRVGTMKAAGKTHSATVSLPLAKVAGVKSYSRVFWVARQGRLSPIQAVGGDTKN